MKNLEVLYFALFEEIKNNYQQLIKQYTILYSKTVTFPAPDQNVHRYHPISIAGNQIHYSDPIMLSFPVWQLILKLKSTKKIFNYIIENNLSPFNHFTFEEDIQRQPSITRNLIADFVVKTFEYSGFGSDINIMAFNKAYSELEEFLVADKYNYKLLINLHGPLGDIDTLLLGEAKIRKADYEISKLFCFYYTDSKLIDYVMLENDYYIEIEKEVAKPKIGDAWTDLNKLIDSIFNCLILSCPGNISKGEFLHISNAWPLLKTEKESFHVRVNRYNDKSLFRYEFNNLSKDYIQDNYSKLKYINYEKLDEKIKTSLQRLKNSKASLNIEDKIIELVLSIEYLINTASYEVTLQLTLKMIKLYDESNQDKTIYKSIKDFFSLRADVVHGKKKVEMSTRNVELIQRVESITQKILVKYIILNQDYAFAKINDAVDKSLFLDISIDEILKS